MSIHRSLFLPDMSVLTDKELQKFEKPIAQANTEKDHFIPPLPIKILLEVVRLDAVAALPLVLAIHRQLVMKKKDDTALNEAIWRIAGDPSAKKRECILRKLKLLPQVFELIPERTRLYHYRIRRGGMWKRNFSSGVT